MPPKYRAKKIPTVGVKVFPNVEELGRGDLGQVQVRRLLCFICHDAFDGCRCRLRHQEETNPLLTFLLCVSFQTHPTLWPQRATRRFLTAAPGRQYRCAVGGGRATTGVIHLSQHPCAFLRAPVRGGAREMQIVGTSDIVAPVCLCYSLCVCELCCSHPSKHTHTHTFEYAFSKCICMLVCVCVFFPSPRLLARLCTRAVCSFPHLSVYLLMHLPEPVCQCVRFHRLN